MRKILLTTIVSFFVLNVLAQTANTNQKSENFVSARPKEGLEKFWLFVSENLNYPSAAKANKIEGTVLVTFTVTQTGSLKNFAIKEGIGHGCDEEVIRVFKLSPNWIPATLDGKNVPQEMILPVIFKMK
jgi:periplasmic protein TonB